ncbi:splicing factor U2af large subunit A-like [Cucurbita maxima]|uniref:Splicing factor U2af large subunit A-like n=1 Tax=Cucurbita maxima TaxID=3661 RepID=A0A6J1KDP6_CUCMA|nr:splicing factor U2af large subunit A-like [Cucurbita maxima]XP_023000461.1 splicing factor U2af large subunit A-like [Cucurbita maxima]XP_023000462.1 splicing factor U2af large subunit A-like [Cucurbita maxima]
MSTYSCSKQYSRTSAKQCLYNSNDESAARTRPFSFEDIMLRRKNKESAATDGGDTSSQSRRESIDKHITANRESERHFRHSRGSSLDVQNLPLEESAKISSRRKKEETLLKDNMVIRSDRNNYESGLTLIGKLKHDTNGKDKRQKYGQENLGWGKNDERSRIDIENETGKRHSRDAAGKDRRENRGKGKSERESKRKYQHGDDDRNRDRHITKKHDHGKHHDLESKERKEAKISLSSHHEDSRLKKRRKRSLDRQSKHKKSGSLSPRPPKSSTKLARQKELPLDSHVKKSGRWHSDSDRIGDFTNSSSSQYRRHSGLTRSGLGGYSPRKRRTESAVKTPPVRSPEKKNEGLDLLPAEKVGLFSGSVTSNFQPSNPTVSSGISNDPSGGALFSLTTGKSLSGISSNNLATKTNASFDSIQLTQATRPMRRLYIENLPHSPSEKAIIDCLNGFLTSSGVNHIEGTQPCISCIIHKDRGQALVEFLTPEDASAALSFDGSDFSGSILRIRRPKDYVELVTGDLDKSVAVVNKINDVVEDSPNKIIIAGISNRISSEMLKNIVAAFGPLKAYHFEINNDLNEPCAFLEYVDQSVMPKACAGLNGMKIGGEVLKVFPAVPIASLERNGCQPCYGIPEHVKPLLQQPTVVLKVNVFNADVLPLLSESDINEVLEDIRFECARFGTVKSMNVAKPCTSCVSAEEEYQSICDITDVEIKHEIQEISTIVISRNDTDHDDNCLDYTYQEQGNYPHNGRHKNEVVEDKLCHMGIKDATCFEDVVCKSALETIPRGCCDKQSSPGNELHGVKVAKIIETGSDEKPVLLGDSSTVVADDEKKVLHGMDPMVRTDSDTSEKREKKERNNNLESSFAVGSVFVEFGRLEASCMAAHSLHGRIYDGQEISVEYIPHDLYHKRFPK